MINSPFPLLVATLLLSSMPFQSRSFIIRLPIDTQHEHSYVGRTVHSGSQKSPFRCVSLKPARSKSHKLLLASSEPSLDQPTNSRLLVKKKVKKRETTRKTSTTRRKKKSVTASKNKSGTAVSIKSAVKRKRKTKTKAKRKSTGTKKKKTRTKKKKATQDEIHFWRNATDTVKIENNYPSLAHLTNDGVTDDSELNPGSHECREEEMKSISFTVKGNPVPLARHRTYRGFIFNPSAKKQMQFCNVVLDMLPLSQFTTTNVIDGDEASPSVKTCDKVIPLFPSDEAISIRIISRMKRPKIHFISSKPGPGRLRESAASRLQITRQDVDNLAKFVLDSLNGVLYADDRQVATLEITKVYDDDEDGLWRGSTDVMIEKLSEKKINEIISGPR
uniref:Uncharacterized protein n=1 Tax=Chaetoceros debilis TaxID=122233 RepID=A0A7S3Q0B5_9STRA